MYNEELRCPHRKCHKLVGKIEASEKSIAKVHKCAPIHKTHLTRSFESKCPKCGKLIYIELGFIGD